MSRSGIKGYHVILTSAKKIMADEAEDTKEKEIYELKLLNSTAFNGLIFAQENKV